MGIESRFPVAEGGGFQAELRVLILRWNHAADAPGSGAASSGPGGLGLIRPLAESELAATSGENEGLSALGQYCAFCGLPRQRWTERGGAGVVKEGLFYCSQACATGVGPQA